MNRMWFIFDKFGNVYPGICATRRALVIAQFYETRKPPYPTYTVERGRLKLTPQTRSFWRWKRDAQGFYAARAEVVPLR